MLKKSSALLSTLAALTVTAPAIARNIPEPEFTPPQCQQYTSSWIRADGGCVNPSLFTEFGIPDRQIQAQQQEITPIVGYGLYIERTDYGSIFITGQLHNQSAQPIYVLLGYFRLQRKLNGRVVQVGQQTVIVNSLIGPGETVPLRGLIPSDYPTDTQVVFERFDEL